MEKSPVYKMNMDRDASSTDEYFVTAVQIFDYCGADSGGALRVDALMEKFAPFVKTNIAEYSFLKSLLDPEHTNPEISVTRLAVALREYSESQKVNLDESFNLKTGPMPQDSDSGISTDGFQLLEDLQCELREKAHLAHQLRSQLDFTDRQHEEVLATLTAERDSLRSHLNMLRDENMTITHVRRDYEEACERLCTSEQALSKARQELDSYKKRNKVLMEQVSNLETDKLTLQELLTKSKDECHRINEMYASRQSALREENETLKTEHADLSARLQDQEEFMQQIIKEKVLLEMELKEQVNRSNHTQLRMDHSIDVSYTDDLMLTSLDTINAESRFTQENRLLAEESFFISLSEDQGRATNISLFDEIRLSMSNMSKQNFIDQDDTQFERCDELEQSLVTIGTQTAECIDSDIEKCTASPEHLIDERIHKESVKHTDISIQTELFEVGNVAVETQTEQEGTQETENNNCIDCTKCHECTKLNEHTTKLESDLKHSKNLNKEMHQELEKYEANLIILQKILDEGNERNSLLQSVVNSLQTRISLMEAVCNDQRGIMDSLDSCFSDSDQMSVSTQAEIPCDDCAKRKALESHKSLRRYLWEPLKSLFQIFALVSFMFAVFVLYGVTRRWNTRCERDSASVPWRWLDAQEFMDLLLRIEYVADVPM